MPRPLIPGTSAVCSGSLETWALRWVGGHPSVPVPQPVCPLYPGGCANTSRSLFAPQSSAWTGTPTTCSWLPAPVTSSAGERRGPDSTGTRIGGWGGAYPGYPMPRLPDQLCCWQGSLGPWLSTCEVLLFEGSVTGSCLQPRESCSRMCHLPSLNVSKVSFLSHLLLPPWNPHPFSFLASV